MLIMLSLDAEFSLVMIVYLLFVKYHSYVVIMDSTALH